MLEIIIEDFGTKIAIGLKGTKEEIEIEFYSFWLHKICNGELQWLVNDNFAYFWSTRSKFITGITNKKHHNLCVKTGLEFEGPSILSKFKKEAEDILNDLLINHNEAFVGTEKPIFSQFHYHPYQRNATSAIKFSDKH